MVYSASERVDLRGIINMKILIITLLTLIFLWAPCVAYGEQDSQKVKAVANTYVLIVGGINRDAMQKQVKDKAVIQLRKVLVSDLGIDEDKVEVLVEEESFVPNPNGVSTEGNLQKVLSRMAERIAAEDRFIFYYVGQANVVGGKLRFNLPGADITHEQLAEWLGEISARSQVVVLDCPGGGMAVKSLAAKGRIIICAARSDQPYSTRFSEFFIPALIDKTGNADYNKDSRISLLEAFQYAGYQMDQLFRQQSLMLTETPLLEDNGDGIASGQPWRYLEDDNDGAAAAEFFLDRDEVGS